MIDRTEAEGILGQPISPETWERIEAVIGHLDSLAEATTLTSVKVYAPQRETLLKRLEKCLGNVSSALKNPVILAANEIADLRLASERDSVPPDIAADLAEAEAALVRVVDALRIAEPYELNAPSEAGARIIAIRRLQRIFVEAGLPSRASDGRDLGQLEDRPSESDLTPFEQLISALGLHQETPNATTRKVRAALAKKG